MDDASLLVAIGSACISLAALWWARASAKASGRSALAAERSAIAQESAADAARSLLEVERDRERVARSANTPTLQIEAVFDPENGDVVYYLHNHGPTLARNVSVCLRDQANDIVLTGQAPIAAMKSGARETVILPIPEEILHGLRAHQLRIEEAFRPFGTFLGPDDDNHGTQHNRWLARDADLEPHTTP